MHLLIVDDCQEIHQTLKGLLETFGHTFTHAHSGQDAIKLFDECEPDLILMDLIMPNTDGIEATKAIKSKCDNRYIPILIVSAVLDSVILSRCLEAGADGILPKPVDGFLLHAKIKVLERIKNLTDDLRASNKQLAATAKKTAKDLKLSRIVLEKAEEACDEYPPNIQWRTRPTEQFNGDLVLGTKSPSGGTYLLVADFTGHGLPAALGAMPVSQIFLTLTRQNIPINQIATEINECLYRYLPDNMYATAVIAEVNQYASKMTYWSGGFPDMLVFDQDKLSGRLPSHHMPLGVLSTEEFSGVTDVVTLSPGQRVLIFTDGIIELPDHTNKQFGYEGIETAIQGQTQDWINAIFDAADSYYGLPDPLDDLTLLEVSPDSSAPDDSPTHASSHNAHLTAESYIPWSLHFELTDLQIKQDGAPTHITKMLGGFPELAERLPEISCVLAEAYNNCVDHGLLNISSEIKMQGDDLSETEKFLLYYQTRQSRLENLADAKICITLNTVFETDKVVLNIRITDSGPGFDYESMLSELIKEIDHDKPCHRGVALIHKLSAKMDFEDGGRTMVLVFHP